MGLKNHQYNKILRDYDKKQLENKHDLDQRVDHAYNKIPELKSIDNTLINAAMNSAKLLLSGNDDTLIDDLKKTTEQVKEKRLSLLIQHNFPENYLELQYQCDSCKDTGYIGSDKCHCFKQSIVNVLYSQSNIKNAIKRELFQLFL